jgi:hypothetical protein
LKNTHIDLLPHWTRKTKARKFLLKVLAYVQVIIVLALVAAAFLLDATLLQSQNRRAELSQILSAFSTAPSQVAAELQAAIAEAAYIVEFFAGAQQSGLTADALGTIKLAAPQDATLLRLSYARQEIVIVSQTPCLLTAEDHRAELARFFTYVHMGRITRTSGGYTYEIHVFLP